MCDHFTNGSVIAAPRNLGNGIKHSVNDIKNGNSPGHMPALHPGYLKPQISIEEVDFKKDNGMDSKESSPGPDLPLTSNDRLMVDYKKHKSNSLPTGLVLDASFRSSVISTSTEGLNSDLSDDLESTIELDSSVDIDKDLVLSSRADMRGSPRLKKQLAYTESVSSVTSGMSTARDSEMSSDDTGDEKGLDDDEVFKGLLGVKGVDVDSKLVEWACLEFVPSCQLLLRRCADEDSEEKSKKIQLQLRNLSNRINYFCTEQQRLSGQLKAFMLRGITTSVSTDQFARISSVERSLNLLPRAPSSAKNSSSEVPVNGRESGESHYDHRSYAVKVLRNVSHSLILPLLQDAESGFSEELYHAIVQAMQKIALKVEACLSFNDPTKRFEIHSQIFTPSETSRVKAMMIGTVMPDESTLHSAARSRSSSASESRSEHRNTLTQDSVAQNVIKRTPSGRIRPSGTVFDSGSLPEDFKVKMNEKTKPIPVLSTNESEGDTVRPLAHSLETTPKRFRSRTATVGDASVSESFKPTPLSRYGSTPFIDSEGFPIPGDFTPDYLRPKARRTTVSLSRKEVTRLGLTIVKNVDEAMASTPLSNSEETQSLVDAASDDRFHPKSDMGGEVLPLSPPYDRLKSASLSDILDDLPPPTSKVAKRHGSETRKLSLDAEVTRSQPSSPSPYSPKNYQSVHKRSAERGPFVEVEWEMVQGHQVDPRVARGNSKKGFSTIDPLSPSKGKKSKKQRKESEKRKGPPSEKISASSRFTTNLKKTALALRRMSTATKTTRGSTTVEISSLEVLTDYGTDGSRPASALSEIGEPLSPSGKSRPVKSETMPNHKKRLGTFFRGSKPHSKSVSKADTMGRRKKSQRSGFLGDTSPGSTFTETIDLQYSEQAEVTRAVQEEGDKNLLITVGVAGKQPAKMKRLSTSSNWFDITVTTNIKRFGRTHYTILRTVKQVQSLFDELQTSHILKLPERPDKKKDPRKQCQQIQDFFSFVANHPELRESGPLVAFLMPDDEFGSFSENSSEVNLELIMTFYTPDHYPGPPGSHRDVDIVLPEDTPGTPSPTRTRKSGKSGTLKRGTFHVMKNEGNEDSSTFVIREEDKDALIVACEDERYVVVAGTFEKLVEQLACEEKPDPRFVSTLLLGYRHFSTPVELLTGLLRRFHLELPPEATDEEIVYVEKWRYVIQLRVLDILTYWIKRCWPDFYRYEEVMDMTNQFIEDLKSSTDSNFNLAGTNLERIVREKFECSPRIYSLTTPLQSPPSTPSTPSRHRRSTPSTPTTPTRHGQFTPSTPTRRGQSTPSTPTLRGPSTPTRPPSTPSTPTLRGPSTPTRPPSTPSTPTLRGPGTPTRPPSTPSTPRGHAARGDFSTASLLVSGRSLTRSISHHPVDVSSLTSVQLARQLTLIELEFLKQITTHELAVYTWESNTPENKPYRKNLDNFIARFNKVSYWVASEICSIPDPRARGALIEKFIEIAKQCQEHRNFNTTISLVTGLSLVAVRRLKKSWEHVGEKSTKTYHKLTTVTSPTNNHNSYRKLLATAYKKESCLPFSCIPYFGVFIRDLIFFNDGNPKKLKNGLINFSKLRTMVLKFEELKKYQRSKYVFPPEDRTREFCKNLWCLPESDLYEASYQLEPRETQPSAAETDV